MKTTALVFAATTLFAVASHAVTPPYHVDDGYYGSVTIRASGSCGFKPVTYRSAWLGEVLDSTDASVGFGIITASGELLVLEEDYAPLRYANNDETGVGKNISYTNMVGPELVSFVMDLSGCDIWSIVPNTNSRMSFQWDAYRSQDRVQVKANFKGFETQVCSGPSGNLRCHADGFSGSIVFKGNRGAPG